MSGLWLVGLPLVGLLLGFIAYRRPLVGAVLTVLVVVVLLALVYAGRRAEEENETSRISPIRTGMNAPGYQA